VSKFICICPTHRDHRELALLANGHTFVDHDYASLALEDLTAADAPAGVSFNDPRREAGSILKRCRDESIEGVITSDDYPGTTLASVVADELKLPAPAPKANLLCQHKFYSRQVQAAATPEATPEFHPVDVRGDAAMPPEELFPLFVKPVKSFFSVGAQRVESRKDLAEIKARWAGLSAFFQPFEIFLNEHTGLSLGTNYLIAEGLLKGHQSTLDGFVVNGEVQVMGVVDSIMFPNTIAFQRFEYPSSLPASVQERMAEVARKVMPALGYDNGQFNIEFIHSPESNSVHIVEINPRMSSQFADLYEKVDGTNSYSVLLDLALGKTPQVRQRQGEHRAASSCVLRTFQNQKVVRLPSRDEIETLRFEFPDIRIEILATEGRKLSEQMQDTCSYRYGLLNIGGRDRGDILEEFDYCKRKLTFVFEPVRA
jgi:biotin carboxylase